MTQRSGGAVLPAVLRVGDVRGAGILPASLGIGRTWVGLFLAAPAGPWLRIDGRVLRPALLRDPPTLRRPPCRLRLSTDDHSCARGRDTNSDLRAGGTRARENTEERADVHDSKTLCAPPVGVRTMREAAMTPPTVWRTTQNGRRHDAAGFARSLRAGGPHMNSRGCPGIIVA